MGRHHRRLQSDARLRRGVTTERRTLESEVALVHLTDHVWLIARDVVTLDGRPLPPSQRLPLTTERPASLEAAVAAFREIARQGARFNIGGIRRDLNVPTLALWFLSDALRERFVYEPAGTDTIDGVACQIVAYTERARPWLLRADGRPVPVRGRAWIAAAGAVLKTELTLDDSRPESAINRSSAFAEPETGGGRAVIAVDYGFSEAVHAWVPTEMRERYDHPGGVAITGRAEYRASTGDSRSIAGSSHHPDGADVKLGLLPVCGDSTPRPWPGCRTRPSHTIAAACSSSCRRRTGCRPGSGSGAPAPVALLDQPRGRFGNRHEHA